MHMYVLIVCTELREEGETNAYFPRAINKAWLPFMQSVCVVCYLIPLVSPIASLILTFHFVALLCFCSIPLSLHSSRAFRFLVPKSPSHHLYIDMQTHNLGMFSAAQLHVRLFWCDKGPAKHHEHRACVQHILLMSINIRVIS